MKRKISKYTLFILRQSEYFQDVKNRSRAIQIIDILSNYIKEKQIIEYPVKKNYLQVLKNSICKTDNTNNSPVKEILLDLEKIGMICIYRDVQTIYQKKGWSFQVNSNFQDNGWYHFTENDSEMSHLKEIETRNEKIRVSNQSDFAISVPEEYLERLEKTHKSLVDIFKRRNDGEDISTEVHNSKCGRLYSEYTNIEREIRHNLIDLNTGMKLKEIDNKASQVSFLIKFLKDMTRKTASKEMNLEILKLESIQFQSSFHDYFQIQLSKNGLYIERDLIKSLVFKLLFGEFSKHFLPVFKDELLEKYNQSYLKSIWYNFLNTFKSIFPEIYKYLYAVTENMKNQNETLARNLQKIESNWLKDIIKELKKFQKLHQDFQFITIHDSISFSAQYFSKIKRIYQKVNHKWKKYNLNVYMKKDISQGRQEESNYISFLQFIKNVDLSPLGILNILENQLANFRNIPNIC
jgi:hypothetical protein